MWTYDDEDDAREERFLALCNSSCMTKDKNDRTYKPLLTRYMKFLSQCVLPYCWDLLLRLPWGAASFALAMMYNCLTLK